MSTIRSQLQIQSTAGAVPIKNEKGQIYMEKVRVQRYVAGKRPDYAQAAHSSSEDERELANDYSTIGSQKRRDKSTELAILEELALVGEYPSAPHPSAARRGVISRTQNKRSDLSSVFPLAKAIQSRPALDFANKAESDQEESDEEDMEKSRYAEIMNDPRMRRLLREQQQASSEEDEDEDRVQRHKRLRDPEFVATIHEDDSGHGILNEDEEDKERQTIEQLQLQQLEEDDDEEQTIRRREMIRERALLLRQRQEEQNFGGHSGLLAGADDAEREELLALSEGDDEFDDEGDEDDDSAAGESDEEYGGPPRARRLKPVFVRKRDRVTLQAARKEQEKAAAQQEQEQRRLADERRRQTLRMLNEANKVQVDVSGDPNKAALLNKPGVSAAAQATAGVTPDVKESEEALRVLAACNAIDSSASEDEINEEVEYEAWKVRELARIRRDRSVVEQREKEKADIERLRQMNDEELRQELKRRPRKVVNKAVKGKYKFLQKYYHRGAFFVQEKEDRVFQQDFAQPTLEDHFDKTRLPKVMQVKNFGLAGRTKYTHLVDQDTTLKRGPGDDYTSIETQAKMDFHRKMLGGGEKQIFDRPSAKKKRL